MSANPLEEIMNLPVDERLRVAEDIWESIRCNPDGLQLTDPQRAELGRRRAAYVADPEAGDDLDTVLSRIRDKK